MRSGLAEALARADLALARSGVWWNAAERAAIVRETAAAAHCPLCARRRAAPIPQAVEGEHLSATDLPTAAIEAIHRIATDSGRLSRAWYRRTIESGLAEEAYVELVSVVALATARATFARALDRPLAEIRPADSREPSRRRPAGAKSGLGWMPMLAPEDVAPEDPPLYMTGNRIGGNVHRALSLVPEAMMQFWDVFEELYLPQAAMRDFGREYRAIDHAQIEMLAARVAVLNACEY